MTSDPLKPLVLAPGLLAFLGDPESAQVIRDFAAARRWPNASVLEGGVLAAHGHLQQQPAPTVLIVDIDDAEDPVRAMMALAEIAPPEMNVVAIGRHNDLNLYRELLELGVADYLTKPINVAMFERALRRGKRGPGGEEPKTAQIIAMIGARGGVGTTTVAAGLAWCLAHLHRRSVALADLDLHFGNLALSLDLVPGPGLREALEYPARMDARLLSSAILHESPQLSVLAAEEPLVDLPEVTPPAVDALVNVLRADHDIVIFDLPRHLDEIVRRTITIATTVAVVTDLSVVAARDTLRLIELNRNLAPSAQHKILGNQVGAPHRGEVGRAEFERVVGRPLDLAIPFEPQTALTTSSTGTALPAALRNSKAAAEIAALAQQIGGVEASQKRSFLPTKLLPRMPGWLKRSA
ncbi:MAG TPA: AAA family ATPase [Stellaceae bacterium]|jgi:pilus assembly protein CpaE